MKANNNNNNNDESGSENLKQYIRGVNVGGWLTAERFITPYLFAVNTCHTEGNFCWYPGQVGMPEGAQLCDPAVCKPILPIATSDTNNDYHPIISHDYMTYPIDEYTLGQALHKHAATPDIPQKYMERHWDTFVTKQDVIDLRDSGVTHLRVPMSYWIRGDVTSVDGTTEPWISGGWPYFVRFANWCREVGGLTIWADLHGAPGSENGFDNSGRYNKDRSTCDGWDLASGNIDRTLTILQDLVNGMVEEGLTDVVSGFGLLNEPFADCHLDILFNYYNKAFEIVRSTMHEDTAVFISDTFRVWEFNNGFWADEKVHHGTYLDSHAYQIFFKPGRTLLPRQHVAYVCRGLTKTVNGCCFEDAPKNKVPAKGLSRIVGEWSGAFDQLPTAMTPDIMKHIAANGTALFLDRELAPARKNFLESYIKAQMVAYESADTGVSSGWLFWNFKMEGSAFIEWDFLRGIREGWIPKIPAPTISSESLYGSCMDIHDGVDNEDAHLVMDLYPDPSMESPQTWYLSDDLVGKDYNYKPPLDNSTADDDYNINAGTTDTSSFDESIFFSIFGVCLMCILFFVVRCMRRNRGYTTIK